MKVDRDMLKHFRTDLDAAIKPLIAKYKLQGFVSTSCTFDPTAQNFTFKVEGTGAEGMTKEASYYEQQRRWHPHWPKRGESFTAHGRTYVITGANSTGSRIKVTDSAGKPLQYRTDAFMRMFPDPAIAKLREVARP